MVKWSNGRMKESRMLVRAFLVIVAVVTLGIRGVAEEVAPLTQAGKAQCAIFCDQADPLCMRTTARLADYLLEQTGVRPPVLGRDKLKSSDSYQTLIIIDGKEDLNLLSEVGVKADIPTDRTDAYALSVVRQPEHWIIAAAGQSPAGAKYAVYRLMEEMDIDVREASVRPMSLRASPFFATRSVSLFNIWRVPVDIIRQCNLESWPAEKIQRSVDTYDAFGFNAIETHDRFGGDWLKAVYGITREQWRDKVYAMSDRAHENGMTVFLRMWGNSVSKPVEKIEGGYTPFGFGNLAPDIPEERKRWEAEIRDYASKTYAGHIDHLIGHWADAGGVHEGSHATVKDSMLLHNELVSAFRAINPRVQSSFNLWGMANPKGRRGWPGYIDHKSIIGAGILPKDVAIAQTTRAHSHIYSEKVTADILAANHPAAVWTWRRADTEVRSGDPGLRIRVHELGDYFRSLPDSARQLSWHNVERNHHGLANDVNYYIAGKLMWDPKTNVDAALLKYCQLVFGKANAPAVAEALNTIEASRDVENENHDQLIAHSDGGRRARAALDGLSHVQLPADFHSRLPSVTTPEEMLDQLRDTLEVIAENGQIVAEKLPELDGLLKNGKSEEAKALAAALEAKADAWYGTVAGGVEGLWLKETLAKKLAKAGSGQ